MENLFLRLFVGLDIPDSVRDHMRMYVERLKSRGVTAKWTNPNGWHITLKFIGNTTRESEIRTGLKMVTAAPIEIAFRDIGFFTPKQPRVFYAGIQAPPTLRALAAQVDRVLAPCGVTAESKPYAPHLTLARTGSGNPHMSQSDRGRPTMDALQRMVEAAPEFQHPDFGTMTANEFVLYLSELSPQGARYTKLKKYPLR